LNPSPYRLDALLNRTGRSRVISCHSRDIGVACLQFCNHYKDNGQGHMLYHDLRITLSVLIKVLRSKCVVVVAKLLKVLATLARQMDALPPLDFYFMFTRTDVWEYVLHGRQEYGFCSRATDVCPARVMCVRSCSRLWWP
jgi:hypothetical protein